MNNDSPSPFLSVVSSGVLILTPFFVYRHAIDLLAVQRLRETLSSDPSYRTAVDVYDRGVALFARAASIVDGFVSALASWALLEYFTNIAIAAIARENGHEWAVAVHLARWVSLIAAVLVGVVVLISKAARVWAPLFFIGLSLEIAYAMDLPGREHVHGMVTYIGGWLGVSAFLVIAGALAKPWTIWRHAAMATAFSVSLVHVIPCERCVSNLDISIVLAIVSVCATIVAVFSYHVVWERFAIRTMHKLATGRNVNDATMAESRRELIKPSIGSSDSFELDSPAAEDGDDADDEEIALDLDPGTPKDDGKKTEKKKKAGRVPNGRKAAE
jgi:hypothetical protein